MTSRSPLAGPFSSGPPTFYLQLQGWPVNQLMISRRKLSYWIAWSFGKAADAKSCHIRGTYPFYVCFLWLKRHRSAAAVSLHLFLISVAEFDWRDSTCRNREFLTLTVLEFDQRDFTYRSHDLLNPSLIMFLLSRNSVHVLLLALAFISTIWDFASGFI